jgi:hypothetical protein
LADLTEEQVRLLRAHGLDDDSPDLALKRASFDAALRASTYTETDEGFVTRAVADSDRADVAEEAIGSTGTALAVANTILKSAGAVVPPAFALSEIKDCAEGVAELALKGYRLVKEPLARITKKAGKGLRRVVAALRRRREPRLPVT